jgi:hypothetical protein
LRLRDHDIAHVEGLARFDGGLRDRPSFPCPIASSFLLGSGVMTRMPVAVFLLALIARFVAPNGVAGAFEPTPRYAIVVKKDVAAGPWGKVVRYLEKKYNGKVFAYVESPDDVRRQVGAYHPRYVCFVCQPTENFPDFALVANKFCRTLDDDPYVDAI